MTKSPRLRAALVVVIIYIASRGLLLLAGLWGLTGEPFSSRSPLGSGRELQGGNLQREWHGPPSLEIWARWDSEWYLLIAEHGYHLEDQLAVRRVAYGPADATGFFPLYPLLIRGGAWLLDRTPVIGDWATRYGSGAKALKGPPPLRERYPAALLVTAVLISNAALLGSLFLLFERAGIAGHGDGGARDPSPEAVGLFSCSALLAWPPSLFLSAVYAESLLLFLSLLCFKLLRRGRWWAAAMVGAAASATKPAGLFLVLPAVIALIGAARGGGAADRSSRSPKGAAGRGSGLVERWASLLLYPAGAVAFSLYCRDEFGDALSWLHRQDRWRGAASGPWHAFVRWAQDPAVHGAHGSTVELIFAVLALLLLIKVFRERPLAESWLTSAVVLLPLCSTLWSFGRLSLQAFPIFIALGSWAARHPKLSFAWFIPSAAGGAALMAYFGAWWWAG